jgi:hypothetical protein
MIPFLIGLTAGLPAFVVGYRLGHRITVTRLDAVLPQWPAESDGLTIDPLRQAAEHQLARTKADHEDRKQRALAEAFPSRVRLTVGHFVVGPACHRCGWHHDEDDGCPPSSVTTPLDVELEDLLDEETDR